MLGRVAVGYAVKTEECNSSKIKEFVLVLPFYVHKKASCENVLFFFVRRLGKAVW